MRTLLLLAIPALWAQDADAERWFALIEEGTFFRERGGFADSLIAFRKALKIAEELTESEPLALPSTYANTGSLYLEWKRPGEALLECRKGLPLLRGPARYERAAVEGHLHQVCAFSHYWLRDDEAALREMTLALDALRPYAKEIPRVFAQALVSAGAMDYFYGRSVEAELRFNEVIEMHTAAKHGDTPALVIAYEGRAALLAAKGAHAEAAGLFEQVLAMQGRLYGTLHPRIGPTMAAYAKTLRALKRNKEAKEYEARARTLEERFGPDVADQMISIHGLKSKGGK